MRIEELVENVNAKNAYDKEIAMLRSSEDYRTEVEKARPAFAEIVYINNEEEWNTKADYTEIVLIFVVLVIIGLAITLLGIHYYNVG